MLSKRKVLLRTCPFPEPGFLTWTQMCVISYPKPGTPFLICIDYRVCKPTKKQTYIHRRHVFASNSTRVLSFTGDFHPGYNGKQCI